MDHLSGLSLAIDTSELDAMALSLRDVVKYSSPDAVEAIGSMVALLEMEARATILGGGSGRTMHSCGAKLSRTN